MAYLSEAEGSRKTVTLNTTVVALINPIAERMDGKTLLKTRKSEESSNTYRRSIDSRIAEGILRTIPKVCAPVFQYLKIMPKKINKKYAILDENTCRVLKNTKICFFFYKVYKDFIKYRPLTVEIY